jgi:hypothetical protein
VCVLKRALLFFFLSAGEGGEGRRAGAAHLGIGFSAYIV